MGGKPSKPEEKRAPPPEFPGHDGGEWTPAAVSVKANYSAPAFAENIARRPDGVLLVSLHSHSRVDELNPKTGALRTFVSLPGPATGLVLGPKGELWVSGGAVGIAPGKVWRVDQAGAFEEWATVDDAIFMNGGAMHPNGRSVLFCESITGRVLAVSTEAKGGVSTWLASDILKPTHEGLPGANGIKFYDGWVYISVTDADKILRARVGADGAPGELEVWADRLRADDFAFSSDGSLFVATHPANTVVRVSPGGVRSTLVGPEEGCVGATAVLIGRGEVFVTTNGGLLSGGYKGAVTDARVLRLAVRGVKPL